MVFDGFGCFGCFLVVLVVLAVAGGVPPTISFRRLFGGLSKPLPFWSQQSPFCGGSDGNQMKVAGGPQGSPTKNRSKPPSTTKHQEKPAKPPKPLNTIKI
jgi:hypothetical protein